MTRMVPVLIAPVLFVLSGCMMLTPDSAFPTTMIETNRIVNDDALTAQEKRVQLRDLGLSDDAIDALLRDDSTGNQGGGDLRTAFDKITSGGFDELTPDEIQTYADEASQVDAAIDLSFRDEVARLIANLFMDEGISNATALGAFLDDPMNVALLPQDVQADDLRALFIDFDPNTVLERLP